MTMSKARRKGDKIKGGKADSMSPKEFDKKQLKKGTKHETEHTNKKSIAQEIAMDHLAEDKEYYVKLDKMEGKKMKKEKEMPEKKEKDEAEHLEHPQMEKKMPADETELCNDCAPHLHHPQIPAASGHTEPQFDPKKGFKTPTSILGKK